MHHFFFFFFNDTATTEIYTLSLHDALPISCSDDKSHLGWFVSYANESKPKITLVVLLRGNTRRVKGPTAALVAGRIYRRLREENYFAGVPRRNEWTATSSGN